MQIAYFFSQNILILFYANLEKQAFCHFIAQFYKVLLVHLFTFFFAFFVHVFLQIFQSENSGCDFFFLESLLCPLCLENWPRGYLWWGRQRKVVRTDKILSQKRKEVLDICSCFIRTLYLLFVIHYLQSWNIVSCCRKKDLVVLLVKYPAKTIRFLNSLYLRCTDEGT